MSNSAVMRRQDNKPYPNEAEVILTARGARVRWRNLELVAIGRNPRATAHNLLRKLKQEVNARVG